jgi:hypothetical protein
MQKEPGVRRAPLDQMLIDDVLGGGDEVLAEDGPLA